MSEHIIHHEKCGDHRCFDDYCTLARLHVGDEQWHDGPGFYYTDDEYSDEGSCGAFATRDEAIAHATEAGYCVIDTPRRRTAGGGR